jgi:RNase P subunit RPR2
MSKRRRWCYTGKQVFTSAVAARIALNEAQAKGRPERYRYQCPKCGWWHLTSHDRPRRDD